MRSPAADLIPPALAGPALHPTGLKASLQLGQQPKLSLELVGDAVLLLHPPGPGHGAGELKDQSSVRYVSVLVVTWGDFHDIANGQSGPRVLCHSTVSLEKFQGALFTLFLMCPFICW